MTHLLADNQLHAAADTSTTIAGIVLWAVVVAAYLTLLLFTLRSVSHTPLSAEARTRWVWLVVLAPLLGAVIWLLSGRPTAGRQHRSADRG